MGHLGRRGSGGSGSGRNAHRCSMPRLTLYLVDPAPPPSPCLPRSPYRSAVARRRGVSLHDRTTPPSFHVFTIAPPRARVLSGPRRERARRGVKINSLHIIDLVQVCCSRPCSTRTPIAIPSRERGKASWILRRKGVALNLTTLHGALSFPCARAVG